MEVLNDNRKKDFKQNPGIETCRAISVRKNLEEREIIMENEKKVGHTPGPWNLNMHDKDSQYAADIEGRDVNHLNDPRFIRSVCVVLKHAEDSENQFNARLIAAAPDLLEACKKVLAKYLTLDDESLLILSEEIEEIEAAIKKAEGK
jgi:hypothetical protein